jgi:hypothetical protein
VNGRRGAHHLRELFAAIPDANTAVALKHVDATAPNAYEVHLAGTAHLSDGIEDDNSSGDSTV